MSAVAAELLALQRLYHWEKTAPGRIAMTQPMGGGVVQDSTAEGEWEEALWKARYATGLSATPPASA